MSRKKREQPGARELEHTRMHNGTYRLHQLVVNQSYPASVPVERLRKVNDLLGQAILFLTTPGSSPRPEPQQRDDGGSDSGSDDGNP